MFDNVSEEVKKLSASFSISYLGRNMMWLFLPVFFKRHIASLFLIGILTSIPAFTNLLLDIPVGNLIQRASSRLVMIIGFLMFSLPGIMYFTTVPVLIVFGKVLEGISKTLRWDSGWYMAMKNSDKSAESESLSVFVIGKNISDIVGPVIGGFVAFYLGLRYNLAFWTIFGIFAAVYFYLTLGVDFDNFVSSLRSLFRSKTYQDDWNHLMADWSRMKWSVSLILVQSLIYSFFWVAVPLLLDELGANFLVMGTLFGIVAVPKAFQVYFGKISDFYGELRTVSWVSVFLIPVLFMMGIFESLWMIGLLVLVAMMFATALSPALHSYFDETTSDEFEGEMVGFLEFFKHAGQAIGPTMAGYVASVWSISASFYAAGIVGAVFLGLVTFVRYFVES